MVPGGVLCSEDNLSECRGCACKSILGDHWPSWRGQPANIECVTSTSIELTGTVCLPSVVDDSMLLALSVLQAFVTASCHIWSTCLTIACHSFARRILGAAHYGLCVTVVQVPNQQLHHLAANTGQRLPLHMQLNGTSHLSARPQAYSTGLANATYIPGTGLQYGGAAPHLHQRAPIPHHASDASYLQQDPQALAAAAAAAANAAAANAAVYKRTAGLPPHIQQQLLRSGQVLPNQAAPRPPNGLLFETNDIDLSGTLSILML